MADIVMPQLGETVTEGTITKWFKKVGDRVERDELLFEVSTDKVDSEVSSSAAGILAEIRVPEGDTVDVGTVLAVIGDGAAAAIAPVQDAPAAPVPEPVAAPGPEPVEPAPVVAAEPVTTPAPAREPEPVAAPEPVAPVPVAESASAIARPAPVTDVSPAAAAPPVQPETVPEASTASTATTAEPTDDSMAKVLSPVVRRLITEHNLDPEKLVGTGLGGRITREDVLAIVEGKGAPAAPSAPAVAAPVPPATPVAPVVSLAAAPEPVASPPEPAMAASPAASAPQPVAAPEPPAASAPQPVAAPEPPAATPVAAAPAPPSVAVATTAATAAPAVRIGARDEVVAFSNIRRRTGEHMLNSLATSPHAFIAVEVDFSAIDRHRAKAKANFKAEEGFSLTYLPFIARAVVDALRTYPNINASVADGSLVVHHRVNLGVAVDLDFQGLMVPVVRDADGKRLRAIARDIADLAARARSKKLMPDDIAGGTFTISNAGPFGIDLMQSIINQPQVAILSVTSVKKKPVVVELPDGSDTIAIHPMGMLGLSWDHRAFDGAYAASFLHEVRTQLESKDWPGEL